jgi:hypothetical protein
VRHAAALAAAALVLAACRGGAPRPAFPPPAPPEERIAPAPPAEAAVRGKGLELRLRFASTEVRLGEPIVADVELRNVSHTRQFAKFPATARFDLVAYATHGLLDPVASHTQALPPRPMLQELPIAPGAAIARRLELPTRPEAPGAGPGLAEGRWWIVALVAGTPPLRTDPVPVVVRAAAPPAGS